MLSHPMCKLLTKKGKFEFYGDCVREFNCLKEKLMVAPIIVASNWSQPFELICDASGLALGAILGKINDKLFYIIYYDEK